LEGFTADLAIDLSHSSVPTTIRWNLARGNGREEEGARAPVERQQCFLNLLHGRRFVGAHVPSYCTEKNFLVFEDPIPLSEIIR
jgi:hypothetical protein